MFAVLFLNSLDSPEKYQLFCCLVCLLISKCKIGILRWFIQAHWMTNACQCMVRNCEFSFSCLTRLQAMQRLKKRSWNPGTPCQVVYTWRWLQMKLWQSTLSKSITHRSCQTWSPTGGQQAIRDFGKDLVSLPSRSTLRHLLSTWTFRDISLTLYFLEVRNLVELKAKAKKRSWTENLLGQF